MAIKIVTGNNYQIEGENLTIEGLDKSKVVFKYKQIRKIESGYACDYFWTISITSIQGNVWEYRFKKEKEEMVKEILKWWFLNLSKPSKTIQIPRRKYATART